MKTTNYIAKDISKSPSIKDINEGIDSPFNLTVSFNKLIEVYEQQSKNEDPWIRSRAERVLKAQAPYPILRDGFKNTKYFKEHEDVIKIILEDSFSQLLSLNEIKTASIPFHHLVFNSTERFKNIISNAGDDFVLTIQDLPNDDMYITACAIILIFHYGYNLDFKKPIYYKIPDKNGVTRHYKILYNADFIEIIKQAGAKDISQADYDLLIDNFENIELWKEFFPPQSYLFKGFLISNIFDVTDDQSISNIKSNLIEENHGHSTIENFEEIFRSLFNLKDINVGFSLFNQNEQSFEPMIDHSLKSYLLQNVASKKSIETFCKDSYATLMEKNKVYAISDVYKIFKKSKGKAPQIKTLHEQHFKSAILAPIVSNKGLIGVLELVSKKEKILNSINANKLQLIMPYIVSALERSQMELENRVEAIIQTECTSIHSSVYWKFEIEAKNFIKEQLKGNNAPFRKISFNNVYPLYGQIDIKGSSQARNIATREDLTLQLNLSKSIIEQLFAENPLPVYEQILFQINSYLVDLSEKFQVDSEQQISNFFKDEINKLFNHLLKIDTLTKDVNDYFSTINSELNILYDHRKKYDDTITMINKQMAGILDKKQIAAQKMYPHYFERYKTDGVEHNMYIGESITKKDSFDPIYLHNLRLWQLQTMCEMENAFYNMRDEFPIEMDVASMILVFSTPLSISFRMDEKQFDVDGTYNARYEIVKKRVDKAYIKGTNKRVTEKGKMTIVYSQKQDEIEYLHYIHFLQEKGYLAEEIEIVELQDLQAVKGLKAIRVNILYDNYKNNTTTSYSYADLIQEINN